MEGAPEEPQPDSGALGTTHSAASRGDQLVEHLKRQGEGREGVCLEPIPRLQKYVGARRHLIFERRKVNRETAVHRGGKEVYRGRPPNQGKRALGKRPFRPQDLMLATQRVGDHILDPHNELGNQSDLPLLCPMKEKLGLLTYERALVLSANNPTTRPRTW